ncbi:MAG: hypothetical protein GY716_06785 [bacterium]|nr:hypothetical protein [bacterium]
MNARKLTLASVAGSLVLSGIASADFTGLATTYRTVTLTDATVVTVFELYATFDHDNDGAMYVIGTPAYHCSLNSSGDDGFFQVTQLGAHQDIASDSSACASTPDLDFDSFLTINVRQGYTGAPTLTTVQAFDLADFNPPETGFGSPTVVTTDGGWLVSPCSPIKRVVPFPPPLPGGASFTQPPGATHGVILGQFTVRDGDSFHGDLGTLGVNENGVARQVTRDDPEPNTLFSFFGCPEDLDHSGDVGFGDILAIIGAWGPCPQGPCSQDLNGNGFVDFADILAVISAWGPCW